MKMVLDVITLPIRVIALVITIIGCVLKTFINKLTGRRNI